MSTSPVDLALGGQAQPGVTCVRGQRPSLLDGEGMRAMLAPFMAAFMVAAAVFRQRVVAQPFDMLALGLRTLAVAFVVRAAVELVRGARRWRRDAAAAHYTLAWDEEELAMQTPRGLERVRRSDVAAVVVAPDRLPGAPRLRARPVWLCLWPHTGRTHLTIPGYFGPDSDVLAGRLSRWLGEPRTTPPSDNADMEPADAVREAKRTGAPEAPLSVVRSAPHYLQRAPTAWLLAAVFALDAWRVAPASWRGALVMPLMAMVAVSVVTPLAWWMLVRARTRTSQGLAMVLTPSHAIGLSSGGSVSLAFRELAASEVNYKANWSPWTGGYALRFVELHGRDGTLLRYDAALIDTPVEVIDALAEALARVQQPSASTQS